jgi:hypothetical protein
MAATESAKDALNFFVSAKRIRLPCCFRKGFVHGFLVLSLTGNLRRNPRKLRHLDPAQPGLSRSIMLPK